MIVDDVRESRDNVAKLLRFEDDVEIVGMAATGQEAIELALKLEPDIILMDVHLPGVDGITATTRIVGRLPNTAVIMMSVQDEADLLRRAMLAGAREFLSKPFSLDELVQGIRHVHQLAQSNRRVVGARAGDPTTDGGGRNKRAKLITVFSLKGGVGRSTVAANLAIAMQAIGDGDVTLLDANLLYGDLGVMMNVADKRTIAETVKHFNTLDRDLVSDLRIPHSSGVKVMLAPSTPQLGEQVTIDHMHALMEHLMTLTDYVVVDTRPSFDDITLSLLDQSDHVILVLTRELTAVKGAKQYLELSDLLGYDTDRVTLIVNRATAEAGIPIADVAASLRGKVEIMVPDDPLLALRAINEGVPFVQSAPESALSLAIMKLATRMLAHESAGIGVDEAAPASAGTGRRSLWRRSRARQRVA
ncbi:MAG TPA: response regulator [Thermomicrobiales bacterium]|nr:response regulator [Thermomicrobiales bacterium]